MTTNNPPATMNAVHDRELDWLAFRYIAGEMDAAEQADFELQLADDSAACEAVATAVALTDGIYAAMRPPVTPAAVEVFVAAKRFVAGDERRSRFARPAGWLAGVVALSLLAVLATLAGRSWLSSSVRQIAAVGPISPVELATTWNATRIALDATAIETAESESAESDPAESDPAGSATILSDENESDTAENDEADAMTAPDWMLAAVSSMAKQADDTENNGSREPTDG